MTAGSASIFQPWWLGIPVVWSSARVLYHMLRGRVPRIWFFVAGVSMLYLATERQQPVMGGTLFVLLCVLELRWPFYFYSQPFQRNEPASWGPSSVASAQQLYDAGMGLAQAQNWRDGEEKFARASAADPEFAAAWYWLGVSRGWQEKNSDAVEALQKLVQLKPDSAVANAALAQAYLGIDDIKAASEAHKRALVLDPWCKHAREVGGRLIGKTIRS